MAIDVHQPEKPNPVLRTLGDVALPLLTIAGIRAATYNADIVSILFVTLPFAI